MESPQEKLLRDLEARKQALRVELRELEVHIDDNITQIQQDVSGRTQPRWWIRRYPLQTLGIAIATGLLLGYRESNAQPGTPSGSFSSVPTFTGSVVAALKSYAARRAVDHIVGMVEKSAKTPDN